MMPRIAKLAAAAAAAILAPALSAPAAVAQAVVVDAGQRADLALTVYEGGFALVHEQRRASLPQGPVTVILPDLSDRLDIATIRLAAGDNASVGSLTFEREVLSGEALLRRALGATVRVARVNPATGEETFEAAEVLAVAPDLVLRIGDRIETTVPGRIVFDAVPADLRPAPGIVARLTSAAAGERVVSLSYLTDGISWRTSYVGRLADDGDRMELTGWALIDNQTSSGYPAAHLSLISGEVNRAAARPQPPQPIARTLQAEAVADGVALAATGPYYRYALAQTFDVRPRQQTQVELLRGAAVPVVRVLRSEGSPLFNMRSADATQPVTARLTFANTAENGLGVPLPAGLFSTFAADDGREVFQGGAFVTATPVGEEMAVELGQSFDVTLERTVLEFNRSGARNENIDTTQRLQLTNGGSRPAEVEIVETFHGEWRIARESAKHTQLSAFQAMWRVTVPAGGAARVEYRAQIGPR